MTTAPLLCRGRHGVLFSVTFDALLPNVLYASTVDGDILVFDTREKIVVMPEAQPGQGRERAGREGTIPSSQYALVQKLSGARHGTS